MAISQKKIIFITGGTGFIGKELVKSLSQKYQLLCLYRQENKKFKSKNIKWIKGDLMNLNSENKKNINMADIIIHLAGTSSMFDQNCMNLNVEGTKNILKAVDNKKERQFIYASSIEAFGTTGIKEVDEKSPERPLTIYGQSKLLAEKEIIKYGKRNKKLSYIILRIGNVEADEFFRKYGKNRIINLLYGIYELNVIRMMKVIEIFKKLIIDRNYKNKVRFLAGKAISLNKINQRQDSIPLWHKILMDFVMALMKLVKRGGIWYYLAAGGDKRPYRRYSNKIYQELGVSL